MADQNRTPFRERVCPRCGELLAPYADVDEDELLLVETVWSSDGEMHWDCATLAEQRYEYLQCQRCGAESDDDCAGWITDFEGRRLLCPDCITPKEDREDTLAFLDVVTRGQLNRELEGREYPPDLAALAEHEAERLRRAFDDPRGGAGR